jgi:hypothetical protein
MAGHRRTSHKHSARKTRRISSAAVAWQPRGHFQRLEKRWMLTGYFDQIAEEIAGTDGAIHSHI